MILTFSTREAFENILAFAVRRVTPKKPLWIEHEGKHVGKAWQCTGFPGIPKKITVRNPRDDPDWSFFKFHIKKCSKFSLTGEFLRCQRNLSFLSPGIASLGDSILDHQCNRSAFYWIFWISHGFPPKNQWDGMGNILGILFLMDFMVFSMYPWVYISLYSKTEDPIFTIAWVFRV